MYGGCVLVEAGENVSATDLAVVKEIEKLKV